MVIAIEYWLLDTSVPKWSFTFWVCFSGGRYKITLSKLYNFFMGADFSNLFWFGKKMNENSQTKRKKICVTYMWQNFSLQKILSINCKRWCQVCQPSFLLLLFCIIYLKSGHWREQADVEESLKREFSILFCDLTKGFWK